jgi:hypothetical protein
MTHHQRYRTSARRTLIKRRYGLSMERYEYILMAQRGRCLICREFMQDSVTRGGRRNGRSIAVDHDHATGEVRGLLCMNCNAGIGLLGDKTDNLKRAAVYMQAARGGDHGTSGDSA